MSAFLLHRTLADSLLAGHTLVPVNAHLPIIYWDHVFPLLLLVTFGCVSILVWLLVYVYHDMIVYRWIDSDVLWPTFRGFQLTWNTRWSISVYLLRWDDILVMIFFRVCQLHACVASSLSWWPCLWLGFLVFCGSLVYWRQLRWLFLFGLFFIAESVPSIHRSSGHVSHIVLGYFLACESLSWCRFNAHIVLNCRLDNLTNYLTDFGTVWDLILTQTISVRVIRPLFMDDLESRFTANKFTLSHIW